MNKLIKQIEVKQVSSTYFGHVYSHIEFSGIMQVAFKKQRQTATVLPELT